jgi:FAD/FMN-containing dehydrogenase
MTGIKGIWMNRDLTVTTGAGVNIRDLGDFLMERGRGLKTIPGFSNFTVAGAIGTGAHGSSIRYSSTMSDQVVGLEVVDGRGRVRSVTEEKELRAFRIHLGLLGIILKVTLRTHPLYKLMAYNYVDTDEMLFNGKVVSMAQETDQLSIYWYPSFRKVREEED